MLEHFKQVYGNPPIYIHENGLCSLILLLQFEMIFNRCGSDSSGKQRLKWTHELRDLFEEAVKQLGGADRATPKCILKTKNFPGLNIYHVKRHLQRMSRNSKLVYLSEISAAVSNFSVVSLDEEQIAANLVEHGPLSVGINVVFMQTYIGGVSCPYICGKHLDDGVLLVGYGAGAYASIWLKEKPYWIIKNSWGEHWGEKGYYKICRDHNVRRVDSMVLTVTAIHNNPSKL
ncbi:Cysteine proteinase [Thalictrum thalictroides]|uniref:Cysteine proteinase n=1 Tax=Thalictrum thalictroides TaxID=46969 RepID=A0A7J6W2A5_THATH|nr:Cysteine proteinase [Thalictrum thalictroides]